MTKLLTFKGDAGGSGEKEMDLKDLLERKYSGSGGRDRRV